MEKSKPMTLSAGEAASLALHFGPETRRRLDSLGPEKRGHLLGLYAEARARQGATRPDDVRSEVVRAFVGRIERYWLLDEEVRMGIARGEAERRSAAMYAAALLLALAALGGLVLWQVQSGGVLLQFHNEALAAYYRLRAPSEAAALKTHPSEL